MRLIWPLILLSLACSRTPRPPYEEAEAEEEAPAASEALSARELYRYSSEKQGHLSEASDMEEDPIEARIQEARDALERGALERACHAATLAGQAAPRRIEPPILLGRCELQRKRPLYALTAYKQALKLKPDDSEALYGQAVALVNLGRAQEAAVTLRRLEALLKDPKAALPKAQKIAIYKLLAASAAQGGDHAKALAAYEALSALAPEDDAARHAWGELLLKAGQDERAYELLSTLEPRRLADPVFNLQLGALSAKLGHLDEAARLLKRSAATAPKDGRAWRNLAAVYERQGKIPEAIKAWEALKKHEKRRAIRDEIADRLEALEGGARATTEAPDAQP